MTVTQFNELALSEELHRAIADMGFETPSPIQAQAIPFLLEGNDIIGQAQTGTGKTAAFGIPTVEKINASERKTQALILCPTRELALQVSQEIKKIAKYKSKLFAAAIYGGESITRQIKDLQRGVQIVIGTPGRVIDHITRGTLNLDHIQTIILDEADEMLNMGFKEDIEKILKQLPEERQTILFSATMPQPIMEIAKKHQKSPKIVKMAKTELTSQLIEQRHFSVKSHLKNELLTRLMDFYEWQSMLIFCNTKQKTAEIAEFLIQKGYAAEALHGDLAQNQRNIVMSKFRHGQVQILVATDVAARGIDVENVEAVINYDIPLDPEYYVHRIGRTGRAGRTGVSFTFISGKESFKLRDIEHYTKAPIPAGNIPSSRSILAKRKSQLEAKIEATLLEAQSEDFVFSPQLEAVTEILAALTEKGFDNQAIAQAVLHLHAGTSLQLDKRDIDFADDFRKNRRSEDTGRGRNDRYGSRPEGRSERGSSYGDRNTSRGSSRTTTRTTNNLRGDMARLFINVGKQDKVSKGDILGAIAGETGIKGREIGSIDVFDSYSFVEVPKAESEKIVRLMNKAKIKGNKVNLELAK
ncbi:DEAD/DEAH box helicase [Hugenholtzia roseola]|uniref:DEAD/DEAH box helicase n=1 Tax=Hugenholtzia roseola TaxID=1002 RepID=UPI0003FE25E7|nr:DEAD/DEAH box helicase [Hugenholtzia roseola]